MPTFGSCVCSYMSADESIMRGCLGAFGHFREKFFLKNPKPQSKATLIHFVGSHQFNKRYELVFLCLYQKLLLS